MPELPEVETLCRQLQTKICGEKILATETYDDKLATIKNVRGQKVTAVEREGKRIVIVLDNGYAIFVHLRMTGRLLWQKERDSDATKVFFKEFALKYFLNPHACRKTKVKTLIMEKTAVEVIGNIY